MSSIAFFTAHDRFPWSRQLLDAPEAHIYPRFTINVIEDDCELLVVYDDLKGAIETRIPREKRVVVLSEPPGIKTYYPGFLNQFGIVLGPIEPENHRGQWIQSHPALPWFYGIGFTPNGLVINQTVADLMAMKPPEKLNAISVVISNKSKLPKHRARLAFVEALKKELGNQLHVFGRGFKDITDKAEAILPYAYHLVLENNDIPNFWTEKTADAYLGWAYPIFSGCANIGDYFDEKSIAKIDIADFNSSVAILRALLTNSISKEQTSALGSARDALIRRYGLIAVLSEQAQFKEAIPLNLDHESVTPNNTFNSKSRLLAYLRGLLTFSKNTQN